MSAKRKLKKRERQRVAVFLFLKCTKHENNQVIFQKLPKLHQGMDQTFHAHFLGRKIRQKLISIF